MTIIQIQLHFLTTDEEIVNICKQYWDIDEENKFRLSLTNIAKIFGLKSNQISKSVAEYCTAYSTIFSCRICSAPYIFANRSDFQNRQRSNNFSWACIACEKAEKQREVEQHKAREEQKRLLIREQYSLSKQQRLVDVHSLSLDSAIYLLALARLGASEDLSFIRPFASTSQSLAPSKEYSYEILKQLYRERLIFVHPDSDTSAFIFEENDSTRFYLDYVSWALPTDPNSNHPKEVIANLESIFRAMNWPKSWHEEWPAIWKKIARNECFEYLSVCLQEHGLTFNPGEKTVIVFNNVLADFSVSQAYNMIWKAARDAAAFYVRERVSKKQAANSVVGSIQRYAERAKAEGWDVKKFGRDRRCPQSLISQVLFNTVLQIGDDGFNEPPASPN